MTAMTDAALKGRAKSLAKRHGISPQEVLQMHLYGRFVARLSQTEHRDRFILKGGLLISQMAGVMNRTSMDADWTVRFMALDEENARKAIEEICSVDAGDGVELTFERIEPIRKDDEYGGLRAHIRVRLGRIDAPLSIDLTTGDAITPREIAFPFADVITEESYEVLSYPAETVIAEKFETVVRRGTGNTRARDLYDLVLLLRIYRDAVDWDVVREAIRRTSERRGSLGLMADYRPTADEIRGSQYMRGSIWAPYAKANPYIGDIDFDSAVDALVEMGDLASVDLLDAGKA